MADVTVAPICVAPLKTEKLTVPSLTVVVLETVNAPRAFLTTDSGFPVNDLEQALRTNHPFNYDFKPTPVPVMFGPEYWTNPKDKDKEGVNFIETFISDPSICRLYLGFSKLDAETAEGLRKVASVTRLKAYSHVLDFFGGIEMCRRLPQKRPAGRTELILQTIN